MTRIASGFAATAALIALALPAFADSRLFSVRADKPGVTVDQAFAGGQALTVAGKGGGVTFFRMDNPAGAIDCHQHLGFVASTGERQDRDVDLCAENWQVTLHLTARAIVAEPRPEPVPPAPPAPAAAAAEPPQPPAPPAAPPRAPTAAVVTGATQTVTITTDDPAVSIQNVFLERQELQILGRQGNGVEIAVQGGPGKIQCQRDLGVKLSDGRTMARKVNICDHNWSVLVMLAGEEAPLAGAPAPPAKALPAPPPVASLEPGEPPPPSSGGEAWFFVPGADTVAVGYGIPRTETGELVAICRPGSGQTTVRILRPMPGGQVGRPPRVTLAAGPVTRTYQAVASPMTDVAAGPHPQFNVPPADVIWQALIHEAVLIVQIGQAPPYTIPLQGSSQPIRQFLGACGLPGGPPQAGGPPVVGAPPAVAGPPGAGLPYACNDGSFLQVQFDTRQGTAFVVEPGAPPALLFRVPARRPDAARYTSGPALLIGIGEALHWSWFGEPARVCRPRLP